MGMDRNIHRKNGIEEYWQKIIDLEKIRYFTDFSASALYAPGSASGGGNVADLLTIN